MMIRSMLLLGTLLFSIQAFAVSLTDLNSSLNSTNQRLGQIEPKMLYGGRDVINPKTIAPSTQSNVS